MPEIVLLSHTMTDAVVYILLFISLYFEVFLLVSFVARVMRPAPARIAAPLPSATVIVPCYNESRGIAETIESLLALDYPAELLRVIVVDDGSTDETLSIARTYESDRVLVLHKENGGKHTAMNFGLAYVTTDLVGCLDADSAVAPGAMRAVTAAFADAHVGAVTPAIHVKQAHNFLEYVQEAEYRISLFTRFMLAHLGSAFITPGPFSIFRTAIVRDLGGWRYAHSTEDMEMALRIQEAGFLIGNVPGATVRTATPRTLRALIKQRTRWAYGGMRNLMDFRHMIGNRAYGNLGLFILPVSVISIGTAMFFFARMLRGFGLLAWHGYEKTSVTHQLPEPGFHLFFIHTDMVMFLIAFAILLIVAVIGAGTWIGTGKRTLPRSTPLFLAAYGFIAPLWLFTAVYRVARGTVSWR